MKFIIRDKRKKRICAAVISVPVVAILTLVAAVLIKTFTFKEPFQLKQLSDEPVTLINPNNETKLEWASKLAGAIAFETVSWNDTYLSLQELKDLRSYLLSTFPEVFNSQYVKNILVNDHSILLRVEGKQPTMNPYLLCGHMDVVPVGDLPKWDSHPFQSGILQQGDDQFIYGRGALDAKNIVVGVLQALDIFLKETGQPERSFYVAFGHDEEVGGRTGAKEVAVALEDMLGENNEALDFLLDEGMMIFQDIVPGMATPVVYIGVVEKGWALIELSVEATQVHSSTPPKETAIGILAKAVKKLEENPSPSRFTKGPEYDSMQYLAPFATFLYRMVFSNLWLLHSVVSAAFAGDSSTDAIQRTTTAITIFQGGFKDNVVPGFASATVNHRVHPVDDLEAILEHDKKVIDDDRVLIKTLDYMAPSKVSPYSEESLPFQILANSAKEVFPAAHLTPGTLVANTDTKHYAHLTDRIYRFSPSFLTPNDTSRFHGYNERISVDNFAETVEFYHRVIINADTQVQAMEDVF